MEKIDILVTIAIPTRRGRDLFRIGGLPQRFEHLARDALKGEGVRVDGVRVFHEGGVAIAAYLPVYPLAVSPREAAALVRSAATRVIKQEYPELSAEPTIWTSGLWHHTGGLAENEADVRAFFASKKREHYDRRKSEYQRKKRKNNENQ